MESNLKIIIEKIENKETEDEKEFWYVSIPNIKQVTTELYSQKIENDDFDIKIVIDAFNQ